MKQQYQASRSFTDLHGYLRKNRYKGYEFDDFLASPLVRLLCFNNLFLQRVAIQAGKFIPFNIRPFIGIPKLDSTKARGFIAKGYLYEYLATQEARWLDCAEENLDWLMEHAVTDYPGKSWGNAFDFASRGGFFPKGRPTVVWTAHIAEVFDLAYRITGKPEYRDVIREAGEFVLGALDVHVDSQGICFGYAPGILNLIHNSNLLGAATLLRCWQYWPEDRYLEKARKSYQWTIADMNPDGSWYYGNEEKYKWIDNFHTAYNLDCLMTAYTIAPGEGIVLFETIEKAYRYWIGTFFEADGTPLYYHDNKYPLNIQCAAQAIETLARFEPYFPGSLELARKILGWTDAHMKKTNGAYLYEIWPAWKNNLECIHWGQSTMLAALGAFDHHCALKPDVALSLREGAVPV